MLSVSIDRIGLVIPALDKEMHGHFSGVLAGMKGEPGYQYWKSKYQTNGVVPLSNQETLRIQLGLSHHKTYVRFDFNPANLSALEWEQLRLHLEYMLEFGYASLLTDAHVSYLEVAVDCHGIEWENLLLFDSQLKNSCWYPDFYAPHPTSYLGRRGSNRVLRAYDRVARLKAAGKPSGTENVTRIEASLRKVGCDVAGLPSIKNPFTSVGICRFADAQAQCSEPGWQQFLKHCRWVGACESIQMAGKTKNKYLERLKNVGCDWWSPSLIWDAYPAALQVLKG